MRVTRDRHLFVLGHRVHHLILGLGMIAAGTALAWHDRRDWHVAVGDLIWDTYVKGQA